jgi:hypothetical protein
MTWFMATPVAAKLTSVRAKTERAKEHISNLNAALAAFYETGPYEVATKENSQTGKLIHYVTSVEPIPERIASIAGDAIQCLRSALDHLAMQLALIGPATTNADWKRLERRIYFPIATNASEFNPGFAGRTQVLRPDAINEIRRIEPYKGGKGHDLWILSELNNIDKHRLLLTVGSAYHSLDLGTPMFRKLKKLASKNSPTDDFPLMSAFYAVQDGHCPLKVGDELFTVPNDAEEYKQMDFRFQVAFSEPGILQGEAVIETLDKLAKVVDGIVNQLSTLLT